MIENILERIAVALEDQLETAEKILAIQEKMYELYEKINTPVQGGPEAEVLSSDVEKIKEPSIETSIKVREFAEGQICTCEHPIETHGLGGCLVELNEGNVRYCPCNARCTDGEYDLRKTMLLSQAPQNDPNQI